MHGTSELSRVGVGWVPAVAGVLALLALTRWRKPPPAAHTRLCIFGPDFEANRVRPESDAEIIAAHDVEQCALEQSEDDDEARSAEAALAAIEADISATTDVIEVTFVSQLETSRTIELHCEGVHVHDLVCGVTFSTSASARQRWSARCGGATLHAWVVSPRSSTDFVLPAQTRLPEPRVVRERRPTARAAAAR